MDEYIQLGHMQKTSDHSKFVIPHHCVTKEDRGEIKLRVVFDGSVKTRNGSLNDSLLIGPPLQTDIRDILLNFRRHAIVFVADAVKMYRQILVHPSDRAYQHILWRFNSSDAIRTYELNTVTYGLSCAPFLALRTLQQLVIDERSAFPLAAQVLSRDIFVDDLATGAPTVSEALALQREIIGLMQRGGFALSKWASNHPAILETVSDGSSDATNNTSITWSDNETTAIKVLGLKWDPVNDSFSYQMKPPTSTVSKRTILSTVARIFDPLGFIAPCTFLMKGFVQELWKLKLGWDDPVPNDLINDWNEIVRQLELLSQIKIPRFAFSTESFEYQLIGFADASQKGYCAALYIRIITAVAIKSHLLTSKTKLAPIKSISIPRLELCGALLLAKLYKSINGFLSNLPPSTHRNRFFSDSTIVLSWLKTPTYRLKTFVANRIGQIAELTDVTSWCHVDSKNNPSDIGSRGSLPNELLDNPLWWSGPPWLTLMEDEWPNYTSKIDEELPELKPISTSVLISIKPGSQEFLNWMSRVSSYSKLIRVSAILLRAMHNRKNKQSLRTGVLKHSELQEAEISCIKLIQRLHFFRGSNPKISYLEDQYPGLKPYIDKFGVARVGGRLSNSSIPENRKYPILLPNKSHFTNLLVDHYHTLFLHPGPNLNQALLQTKFWIPASRRLIRHRLFLCLKCYKAKAKSIPPLMGDLPTYRLEGGRAFLHTGIDFAGPFITRESRRRKAPLSKSYLCLYVCMTTKALHLETVSDLSTASFLASFSRFISRRGLPTEVYSDCGSNFKGGYKELQELAQWYNDEQSKKEIETASASRGIKWNFNPPYSPHFGGLWEAGVKAVKRHLHLAAGNVPLTFEELATLFCRIEAILNSRPLCPLSSDPSEFEFLSPGHFLIGAPLTVNPEPTLLDVEDNRLDRWQLLKKISDQIWQRWHLEYVSTLQARSKWRKPSANLEVGDLVLIKDPAVPQLEWPTARVSSVHPGTDGIVRVVTLRTPSATYKRSVANLIPLLPLKTSAHPDTP
uniref:Integrase catalytic domain-containing protein n=1 Tax=Lygus hesperus TaxID=30085 RepID=A0A146KLP5_LYGHE